MLFEPVPALIHRLLNSRRLLLAQCRCTAVQPLQQLSSAVVPADAATTAHPADVHSSAAAGPAHPARVPHVRVHELRPAAAAQPLPYTTAGGALALPQPLVALALHVHWQRRPLRGGRVEGPSAHLRTSLDGWLRREQRLPQRTPTAVAAVWWTTVEARADGLRADGRWEGTTGLRAVHARRGRSASAEC